MDNEYQCVLPGVSVAAGEHGRTFRPGDVIDVDARVAQTSPLTWRDALGPHLDTHFAPVERADEE